MDIQGDLGALAEELLPATDFEDLFPLLEAPQASEDAAPTQGFPVDFDWRALLAEKAVPAERGVAGARGVGAGVKDGLEKEAPIDNSHLAASGAQGLRIHEEMTMESYFSDEDAEFATLEEIARFKEDHLEESQCKGESDEDVEGGDQESGWSGFVPVTQSALAPASSAGSSPPASSAASSDASSVMDSDDQSDEVKSEVSMSKACEDDGAKGLTGRDLIAHRKRKYRATKIRRWLRKRQRRKWKKEALYDSRVDAAKRRPRSKGKFLKQEITWVPAPSVFG